MENNLITDQTIIHFALSLISLLGAGLIGLLIYIFKKAMAEIKSYRAESLNQRAEFNNTLENKFKSINFYMRQTDNLQVRHEQNIINFNLHARETKAKLVNHEAMLNQHNEKLNIHDLEIKNLNNLKKTG
jgi:hypothetical protein